MADTRTVGNSAVEVDWSVQLGSQTDWGQGSLEMEFRKSSGKYL